MARSTRRAAGLVLSLFATSMLANSLAACGSSPSQEAAAPSPPAEPAAVEPGAPPSAPEVAGPSLAASSTPLHVVEVEVPPFAHTTPKRVNGTTSAGRDLLRLAKESEARNQIIDDAEWFARNDVTLPAFGAGLPGLRGPRPEAVPAALRGAPFHLAIPQADGGLVALYGAPAEGPRYVLGLDAAGVPTFALDFAALLRAPGAEPEVEGLVTQGIRWAVLDDGVLYVSSFHRTYAKTSLGKNAFITAVDPATGELRWQSAPLVSNAANFVLWDGFVVSGYGFTAEPDFMLVLDQATGATLSKTPVKSGPSYLVRKGDQLLVRTYDTDYVFGVAWSAGR